jgi:hypothetical protein
MGYGEFGGNGSIHWRIKHEEGKGGGGAPAHSFNGADPIANQNVGGSHGRPGNFRIEIAFDSPQAATTAYEAARPQGSSIVLHVRANNAPEPPAGQQVPTQISVKW